MAAPRTRPSPAANQPYLLPPRLFDARCKACWFTAACWCWWWPASGRWTCNGRSFCRWTRPQHGPVPGRVLSHPTCRRCSCAKVAVGTWETLAMSVLGTLLAAVAGLAGAAGQPFAPCRPRPGPCTHALAAECAARHPRAGVGRAAAHLRRVGAVCGHAGAGVAHHRRAGPLFAEAIENAPPGPGDALRARAWALGGCFCTPRCRRCCRN
jgi:phosphonate transport system permease protein